MYRARREAVLMGECLQGGAERQVNRDDEDREG
jgi:hypothetical protein